MDITPFSTLLRELVRGDEADRLTTALDKPIYAGVPVDGLLAEAAEHGSTRCLQLLAKRGPSGEAAAEAAGFAAARGDAESVRALIEAGADFAYPEWDPDSDVDHALRGAMLALAPEIVDMVCASGAVRQAHPNWIGEAIEIGVASRKRAAGLCLARLGEAVVDRLQHDQTAVIEAGSLDKLARRLVQKSTPRRGQDAGKKLRGFVDAEAALRDQLIDAVVYDRDFERMFKALDRMLPGQARRMAADMVPWVARSADAAPGSEPGWWALERLLDRDINVDQRDDMNRTALMWVAWVTQERRDLIDRLLEKGADINAVEIADTGERCSVLDHANLGYERENYGDYLRSLGAQTAAELEAEESDSQ